MVSMQSGPSSEAYAPAVERVQPAQRWSAIAAPNATRTRVGAVVARFDARARIAAALVEEVQSRAAEWAAATIILPGALEFAAMLALLGTPPVARSRVGAVVAKSVARTRVATAVAQAAQATDQFLKTAEGQRTLTQIQLASLIARLGRPPRARTSVGAVVARASLRAELAAAVMRIAGEEPVPPARRKALPPRRKPAKRISARAAAAKKPARKKKAPVSSRKAPAAKRKKASATSRKAPAAKKTQQKKKKKKKKKKATRKR